MQSFVKDPDINTPSGSALNVTGYDRGHMVPKADVKWSRRAYRESHYMSNVAPQHGCLNQRIWCHLESIIRDWARQNPDADYINITGMVFAEFIDTIVISKTNLSRNIPVPRYCYKVIAERQDDELTKGVAFIMENKDHGNYDLSDYQFTIDSLESLTGINFFPNLTENEEELIESEVSDWNLNYSSDCPEKTCEQIYSNRVTPEERTSKKW